MGLPVALRYGPADPVPLAAPEGGEHAVDLVIAVLDGEALHRDNLEIAQRHGVIYPSGDRVSPADDSLQSAVHDEDLLPVTLP